MSFMISLYCVYMFVLVRTALGVGVRIGEVGVGLEIREGGFRVLGGDTRVSDSGGWDF